MIQAVSLDLKGHLSIAGWVEYGLVEERDIDAAARIYMDNFPDRVEKWFRKSGGGVQFYRDLMELMRLAFGATFFVARSKNRLIGYLILTLPNGNLLPIMFREGFALRVAAHAVTGKYRVSPSVLRRSMRALLAKATSRAESQLSDSPHVYVVAVDKDYTNRGIGSSLIEQARLACQSQFQRMWLCVDRENVGATRLYQRFGFRVVDSNLSEHVMVWDLQESGVAHKA